MKHFFSIIIALMISLFISATATGQDAIQPFDSHSTVWGGMFAPQSPEALAISRYGDSSPDLYHGSVSLSIPVFEWKDNLFDIPIVLQYNTTGYRPGAACGPEGLDWALVAGGVITREVRGIPDESYTTYFEASEVFYNNPSERPDPPSSYIFTPEHRILPDPYTDYGMRGFANWYLESGAYADASTQKCIYSGKLGEEFVCGSLLYSNSNIVVENEPDIFHFTFPGHSGSFILQPNHGIRFLSCDSASGELQVTFYPAVLSQGVGSSFVVTDGQGVRYTFADIEETNSFDYLHGSDLAQFAVSCWRLSSITHPSGKTVSFTYDTCIEVNISPSIAADHMTVRDNSGVITHPILELWKDGDYYDESLMYNAVYAKHLTGINFAGRGSASFSWSNQEHPKLESISIYNAGNRLLKQCTLNYYVPKTSTGADHETLAFLTSVSLSGEGTYTMTYDSADNNHSFPTDSMSNVGNDLWYTDAYGYYNAISLKYLFDSAPYYLQQKAAYIQSLRVPNLARTRMGTLSSVTYPTGGRSVFTYEQNRWSRKNDSSQTVDTSNPITGGIRVARIDTYDENGDQTQCRRFSYVGENGYSSGVLLQYPNIHFKYYFTSNTPGVSLRVNREAVSTMTTIGFTKDSHIEYLRVVEEISRTSASPVCSRTVHTFNSASSISNTAMETEYIQEYADDQTDYTFVNDGTVLNEWQNHGTAFMAGRPVSTTQEAIDQYIDPEIETSRTYGLYYDINGTSTRGKMIHFGRLCERVYNTASPYMSSETVSTTEPDGTSGSVTTSVTVDTRGRISTVSVPDSHGNSIITAYSYHSTLPGLITKKTVTRGGSAVSAIKFDYTCLNSTNAWFVPSSVSTRLVNGSSFGDWRTDRTFASWDVWGNPCLVTDAAGRTTSWTWGYNGLHPTSSSLSSSGATRQQSWTWIPMVGLDSFTDPSGRTTEYYYDSYGRLIGEDNPDGSSKVTYDYYFPGTSDSRTYSDRTYIATTRYCGGGSSTDVAYYDGLGRLLQTVKVDASGDSSTDIIEPMAYDALGRQTMEEYPYPNSYNYGSLRTGWNAEQRSFYIDAGYASDDDGWFGIKHTFENRADGRVITTTFPGYEEYEDHGSQHSYSFNTYGQLNGYYSGRCSGATTVDGDGHVSTVWTDREGRTVQEDSYPSSGIQLSTVYDYDARGNISSVTQPKGTTFSYTYDALGRQVMKAIPGSAAELYVYDSVGRIVLSQDGKLRGQNRWILNTWDAFDCLTKSQLISTSLSQSSLQAYFPVSGSGSLPTSAYTVVATLAEYGYMRSNGATVTVPSALAFLADASVSSSDLGSSLNLKIYEKLLELPDAGASALDYGEQSHVERAFYYDELGYELQIVERNVLGGITRTSVIRDCLGNPMSVTETVALSANSSTPTVKNTEYDYDDRGRLVSETVTINNSVVSSTSISYDELGRPETVSGNGLTQTQEYNLHGWLAGISATAANSNVFSETLRYAESLHATPLYSGTISEIQWQQGASTPATYAFSYDGAGRLTGSNRYVGNSLDNGWTERDIAYDANSNITAIKRYGSSSTTPVDDLTLSYTGNTLSSVGNMQFSYDSSGNMTSDPLRGLIFAYNILNQPSGISPSSDDAWYTYLADGTKAMVESELNDAAYAYLGSMVFSFSTGGWAFDSTPFSGGRIRKSGSAFVTDRFATDHLGSVRAIVRNGQVIERNDYYPYGGRHENSTMTKDTTNRWRFSDKEIQTIAGVNLLDFGARLYDDRLCHWNTKDPLAEKYPAVSPYAYCAGDPVGIIDTDGKKLYFAKGSSDEFKRNFAEAVRIMNEKGTSYNIARLEASDQVFYIQQAGEKGNQFNWETRTIEWEPFKASLNEETFIMRSPVTSLAHEARHANDYREAVEKGTVSSFIRDSKSGSDSQYHTIQDRKVITTTEQYAARRHGEISDSQCTRKDHGGHFQLFGKDYKTQKEIMDAVIKFNQSVGDTK